MVILKNGDDKVDVRRGRGFKIQGRWGVACALCVVVIIINKDGAGKGAVKEKGVTMTIADDEDRDGDCEEGL